MQSKRGELVPIGDALSGMDGPEKYRSGTDKRTGNKTRIKTPG